MANFREPEIRAVVAAAQRAKQEGRELSPKEIEAVAEEAKNAHRRGAYDIVLNRISSGRPYLPIGRHKWLIGRHEVHVRFCSRQKPGPEYRFNINPNTLTAEYEVWICGSADTYYLVPMARIRHIYDDPQAYPIAITPKCVSSP